MDTNWGYRNGMNWETETDMYTLLILCIKYMGFPGGSDGLRQVKNPPAMWRLRFNPWVGKMPWRRKWHPTPVFLPGESHGQRNPVA